MPYRSATNYDAKQVSNETGLNCQDPSRAVQSQKEESDINTIVYRFGLTGKLPENVRMPSYGDFTEVGDYQTCLNAVKQAEEAFMRMPAKVRARFNNDAGAFVDFCSDENNRKEAEELGLVDAKILKAAASTGGVPPTRDGDKHDEPQTTDKKQKNLNI